MRDCTPHSSPGRVSWQGFLAARWEPPTKMTIGSTRSTNWGPPRTGIAGVCGTEASPDLNPVQPKSPRRCKLNSPMIQSRCRLIELAIRNVLSCRSMANLMPSEIASSPAVVTTVPKMVGTAHWLNSPKRLKTSS